VELLREGPGFYMAGAFTRFPVQLYRLESGSAKGKYIVDSFAEGPLMQGLLARLNVVDGEPTLLLGFLTYEKAYKHPETGAWENPSQELKDAYKHALYVMKNPLCQYPLRHFPQIV
jgi:hypothetical protein